MAILLSTDVNQKIEHGCPGPTNAIRVAALLR
jgi:hypothetical protein